MGRKSDFFLCTPAQLAPSQPGSAFWLPDRWLHKSTCAAGSGQRRRRKSPITRHPVAQRTWRKCRSATSAYQNSPHEWRVEREGQTFVRQMEASPLSFSLHCICTPSGLWYYTHQKVFKYHKIVVIPLWCVIMNGITPMTLTTLSLDTSWYWNACQQLWIECNRFSRREHWCWPAPGPHVPISVRCVCSGCTMVHRT